MDRTNPMSPMRLYRIACSAAVLASVRPCHHPISRNDMIPTPSHPINSWKRLYLKNRLMKGSECMYHMENSIIDHVTNSATGMNITEK